MSDRKSISSVSVTYAANRASTRASALGVRPMQDGAYFRRGEQDLLIRTPSAPWHGPARLENLH